MTSWCLDTIGALSLTRSGAHVLCLHLVGSHRSHPQLVADFFNWGILGERLAGFAGWFWYDERMRFTKATVLARVASDEVEAAVAVLLSSDALIEILLSHFLSIQCEMR